MRLTLLIQLLVVAAVWAAAADPAPQPSVPPAKNTPGTNTQVIAYYFHGTVRCMECLKIEKQARELIERQFKADLAAQRLVFKSVNYEQPEHAHFLMDYKLPCPSLVLVRQTNGRDVEWQLLKETWREIENPARFDPYVAEAVARLLEKQK